MATLGLLLGVALVGGFYALGIAGARSVGGDLTAAQLRRAFVHSLVPIAMVYVAAHYLTFLVFEGQSIAYLASDPLGEGWNLFGTATAAIDYGVLSQNQAWYLQVGFVVAGHVAALTLAHDRALCALSRTHAARGALAVLDARGDGRLHDAGAMAAGRGAGMRRALAFAALLAALGGAGCGEESSSGRGRSDRLVDFSKRPPFVNSLERDPSERRVPADHQPRLLPHRPGDRRASRRVRGTIEAGRQARDGRHVPRAQPRRPGRAGRLGPSRPAHAAAVPRLPSLRGRRARPGSVVSRLGDADLHKIVFKHDRLYAWDAVLSALVISEDGGRSFAEHFTPRGLIIDFEVDPEDPAAHRRRDRRAALPLRGRGRELAPAAPRARASASPGPRPTPLPRAERRDGAAFARRRRQLRARRPRRRRALRVRPGLRADELYVALSDGTILHTDDGGRDWEEVFRP